MLFSAIWCYSGLFFFSYLVLFWCYFFSYLMLFWCYFQLIGAIKSMSHTLQDMVMSGNAGLFKRKIKFNNNCLYFIDATHTSNARNTIKSLYSFVLFIGGFSSSVSSSFPLSFASSSLLSSTSTKFAETKLLPQEDFYSQLQEEGISSDEDNAHAQKVRDVCHCNTFGEYHELYLKNRCAVTGRCFCQ